MQGWIESRGTNGAQTVRVDQGQRALPLMQDRKLQRDCTRIMAPGSQVHFVSPKLHVPYHCGASAAVCVGAASCARAASRWTSFLDNIPFH